MSIKHAVLIIFNILFFTSFTTAKSLEEILHRPTNRFREIYVTDFKYPEIENITSGDTDLSPESDEETHLNKYCLKLAERYANRASVLNSIKISKQFFTFTCYYQSGRLKSLKGENLAEKRANFLIDSFDLQLASALTSPFLKQTKFTERLEKSHNNSIFGLIGVDLFYSMFIFQLSSIIVIIAFISWLYQMLTRPN
ncbi:MAG: hypothetical protein K2P92_06540 [Bdellovibrionaceae bacterium]|nr:hypothetical protein [Pseudobdellovibrionaceae bacterium]